MFNVIFFILITIIFCILLYIRAVLPRHKIDNILKMTWEFMVPYFFAVLLFYIVVYYYFS